MRPVLTVVASACLCVAGLAAAAELQVPLDRAGRVQRIDASLARRLRMFGDRADFVEARLFQLPDSSFVLELASLTSAGMSRERVPLTAAGADSLRAAVSAGLEERHIQPNMDSSGRPLLVATTTLMSFGFYAWAVPYLFLDHAPGEVQTGTYLLTASAGTFVPLLITRNQPVTVGAALMGWYGMSRGAIHGAVLAGAVLQDPPEKSPVGYALGASVIEGVTLYQIAARTGMTEGQAATHNNFGDIGMLYGWGVSELYDADRQAACAATLAGAAVGQLVGAVYAPHRDHTYGDASVMRSAGVVGGYVGLAVAGLASGNNLDHRTAIASTIAGSALGLVTGDGLVRKTDFTFGQGVVVDLSTVGGWLFGLGVAFVAAGDTGSLDDSVYWGVTSAGAVAGYALGYGLNARSARKVAADRTTWRLDVWPSAPERAGHLPGVTVALHASLR